MRHLLNREPQRILAVHFAPVREHWKASMTLLQKFQNSQWKHMDGIQKVYFLEAIRNYSGGVEKAIFGEYPLVVVYFISPGAHIARGRRFFQGTTI